MIARVYRPQRDWKNQRPEGLEDSFIGEVNGVIIGVPSTQPTRQFPGTVTTEGQIGIPVAQAITVQQHDILVIDDVKYAVTSGRQWNHPNTLTGTPNRYYWVEIESTT